MTETDLRFFSTSRLMARERFLLRGGRWAKVPLRVRVGYMHHPSLGHTLIDTGYSTLVANPPRAERLLRLYSRMIGANVLSSDPLGDGLARVGVARADIATVVLTHFHADHVSGLLDLPHARILCARAGLASLRARGAIANARIGNFPQLLPKDFDDRASFFEDRPTADAPFGLGPARDLSGDGAVLAIDLPGHLEGHSGICLPHLPAPFLYAADTQWLLRAILEDRAPGFPATRVAVDAAAADATVRKVRAFAKAGGEVMVCHGVGLHPRDIDRDAIT